MIEYVEGDIFNSPAQTIVNTVNTVGVMGKGIALSYKKRYPHMFEEYRKACEKHLLNTGKLMLYYAPDHWILLFPTKINWRNPSKIEYIEAGLRKFVNTYANKNITSIAFPKLGCGNGELLWEDVKPIMEKYLKPLPITIYIYLGTNRTQPPEHIAQKETIEWLKKNARDMSFVGVCEDLKHDSAIVPYVFISKGETYTFSWIDNPIISRPDGKSVMLKEESMFEDWDNIRKSEIITITGKSTLSILFYELLSYKGYLSPVKVVDNGDNMVEGYQINAGYGRAFALQG